MMKFFALVTLFLSASALNANQESNERPIAKVVRMLKDMTAQLVKEAEADAEMYEQMACWCETGGSAKELAIKTGTQRISDLGAAIEEYSAKADQLRSDIEGLKEDITEKDNALQEATGIRDKELAEFNAEEKDMIASITSLKGAVTVMSKAHGEAALLQVKDILRRQSKKFHHIVAGSLSEKQRHTVMSLIQERTSESALSTVHTPASGEIFGILKQMKESFETNMATSKKEEEQAASDFAEMKKAKTAELAAANGQVESKTVNLGDTEEKFALSTEDKKDTEKAVAADTEFLADLKDKCAVADAEYQARVKVRTEEQQALSETLEILTNEEANDAFTKSMAFIQKRALTKVAGNRKKAADYLKKAAKSFRNPRLVTLAVSARLDAFAKVKENIDLMVKELKQTQKDEVDDRDYCIKSLNENEKQTAAATDTKNDLDTKIADLTSSIASLTEAITALKDEITTTQVEMKKANAIREEENKDFQMTITDQRATQAILDKALVRLKEFYEKKALLQEGQDPLPPPPEQATYKPSSGAGGVMAMIEDVIKESKQIETDAIGDEQTAQAAYEGFIKDSNKLIVANTEDITSKSEAKAKADMEKATAEGDLKGTVDTILTLADTSKTLHDQCDFLLKNFEERQSSRTQEIDALNQAKAIFSGMKF